MAQRVGRGITLFFHDSSNLVPTGIRSRTVQPVVTRYTDWATRPTPRCSTKRQYKTSRGVRWGWVNSFMPQSLCFSKESQVPNGWAPEKCGCYGEERNMFPLPGFKPQFLSCPACKVVTTLIRPSRLPRVIVHVQKSVFDWLCCLQTLSQCLTKSLLKNNQTSSGARRISCSVGSQGSYRDTAQGTWSWGFRGGSCKTAVSFVLRRAVWYKFIDVPEHQ